MRDRQRSDESAPLVEPTLVELGSHHRSRCNRRGPRRPRNQGHTVGGLEDDFAPAFRPHGLLPEGRTA